MATCPKCRAQYADDVDVCEVDGEPLLPDEACANLDADLEPGDLVGEYRVERKIGEGAFGTVYGATHPVIGKAAAIKVLRRQFSSNATVLSRFVAEARAVNQIRHRNIIDIFAFGTLPGGLQYFVMEWLDGVTLQDQLREHGPLPPESGIPLLRDIARALSAAHNAGIAHRDLKPENVFLCFDDEDEVYPKLLDFGIAKLMGDVTVQHKTRTGVAMGTPLYMSPEQCRGQGVDHRTDIYSFGAMTHEVLTGQPPFCADNVMDLMMMQTAAPPPPMSTVRSELPPELDAPVLRMLEKDPAERPQTLRDAVDELTRAAQAGGVEVRGPTSAATAPRRSGEAPAAVGSRPEATGARAAGEPAAAAGSLALARTVPSDEGLRGEETSPSGTLANVETDVRGTLPPAGRGRLRVMAVLAVGALLLAGGALTATLLEPGSGDESLGTLSAEPGAELSTDSTTPSEPPSGSDPTASRADEIRVDLETKISGIEVWQGNEKLGTAPGSISLPRGSDPIELRLIKPGYYPGTLTVTPDRDVITKTVALTRRSAPSSTPTSSTPTSSPPPVGNTAELAFPDVFKDPP